MTIFHRFRWEHTAAELPGRARRAAWALWVVVWLGLLVSGPVVAAESEGDGYADAMERAHRADSPVPSPAAQRTVPATAPRVESAEITFPSADGRTVRGFLARPQGPEPRPGLIVIHEWWGLNDNIRATARQLAARGYDALAVDLYGGRTAATPGEARALMVQAMKDPGAMDAVLRGAHDHLTSKLGSPRTGSIGWCFGGGLSLEAALVLPGELDATVIYYGRVARDPAELAVLKTPILGHFGALDRSIPLESVRAFEATLDEQGVAVEIHVYPGADHAFANPSGTRYDAAAAELAWDRTLKFLARHLQPAEAP